MNMKALVASVATMLIALTGCTSVSAAPVPPSQSSASTVPTVTPSASAPVSPSATASQSASATPSTSPKPKPSATANDPTSTWDAPIACADGEVPGLSHIGVCKVKGKTSLQVLEACRIAANASIWQVSSGNAGKDVPVSDGENSADALDGYIDICLKGSGMSYNDAATPWVDGCPTVCMPDKKDMTGLKYILLTGGVDEEDQDQAYVYDAITGQVIDSGKIKQSIYDWNDQFHGIGD